MKVVRNTAEGVKFIIAVVRSVRDLPDTDSFHLCIVVYNIAGNS
jgi:hypothetical protein